MKEEEAYSILDIISESEGQSVILTRSGSICIPFELRQPECYSLSPEDIDERDGMYREAFRHMPDGTYVHKQDVFLKKDYHRGKGTGSFLDGEDYEMYSSPDIPEESTFGVHVSGDSMEPRYHDRDLIWVEQTEQLEDGEIGIFYLDGNAYVKKFQNNRKGTYLISLNKKYAPIPVTENSSFKIFGRVLS